MSRAILDWSTYNMNVYYGKVKIVIMAYIDWKQHIQSWLHGLGELTGTIEAFLFSDGILVFAMVIIYLTLS